MPSPLPDPLPLTDDLLGVTLLSINQVAELWGCSRDTSERMLRRRELRHVLLGADRRIPATELRRFIERQQLPRPIDASQRARATPGWGGDPRPPVGVAVYKSNK